MGRLLITSDFSIKDRLNNIFKKNGFKPNGDANDMIVYDKLNTSVCNFVKTKTGYISCAGTVVYKSQIGEKALVEIYDDIDKIGINNVRYNIIGSYVIALKKNDKEIVFVDQLNTYNYYYYFDGAKYICLNTMYHIAKMVGTSLCRKNYLVYAATLFCSGGKTPFEGIYQLMGNQMIVIEDGEFRIENLEVVKKEYSINSREEAIKYLTEALDKILVQRRKLFNKSKLFLTGGVDSRLEYAMHLWANEQVAASYWLGDDMITNGREEDAELCRQLAKDFGSEYELHDVTGKIKEGIDDITSDKCDKYGEYVMLYGNNAKWFSIFEKLDNKVDFINLGYMGEALRDISDLDEHFHEGYTIKDLACDMFCRFGIEQEVFVREKNEIINLIEKEIVEDFNQNENNALDLNKASKIFTIRRLFTDSKMTNFANLFTYSFQIFATPAIWDIIMCIPYNIMKNSAIAISLIDYYKRDLLEKPFFSHHHVERYDKKDAKLKASLKHVLRMKIQPIVVNTWFFDKVMLNIVAKYLYPFTKKNDEIFNVCNKVIEDTDILVKNDIEYVLPNSYRKLNLSAYVQQIVFLRVVETIKEDKKGKQGVK
jgi:hypothetical protein